jgi:two-component system chemotaxis response regulator CheB
MAIKVLVVDDSALMRKHLRIILEQDASIQVLTAYNGQDALEKIQSEDPDVVTLDINMPVMDGLQCLAHIMTSLARPVIMVSSLTDQGALATLEAMELGAVDYVLKPGGTMSLNLYDIADELRNKVRNAARARHRFQRQLSSSRLTRSATGLTSANKKNKAVKTPQTTKTTTSKTTSNAAGLVLIGVSTGGPSTLESILTELPADFPWSILVSQHMPARFTGVFATRLNTRCNITIQEVNGPTPLAPGMALIARGEADVTISRRSNKYVAINKPPDNSLWHPCVDRMVFSALDVYEPSALIGVQLTGMGYDGAAAMAALHTAGGRTIAESEETAVVFGMPKELIDRGGANMILPAHAIAAQLKLWVNNR